jgi:hypothetical protein
MGTDETTPQSPESGDPNAAVDEQVEGTGDEGRRAAGASPPIADDAVPGQTQTPASPDDVGVPPDEEMNRPDE